MDSGVATAVLFAPIFSLGVGHCARDFAILFVAEDEEWKVLGVSRHGLL